MWINWTSSLQWGTPTISHAHQESSCSQETGWLMDLLHSWRQDNMYIVLYSSNSDCSCLEREW